MRKILVLFAMLFFLISCEQHKPLAKGSDIAIKTLVSPALWEEIGEELSGRVEFEIRTPQIEKLFYFTLIQPQQYKESRYDKQLLLIASLDEDDETSLFIRSMLGNSIISQVESGERLFFYEYDKFAERQSYMLLLARNREELKNFIRENGNQIYQVINKGFLTSQFKQIYHSAEEKSLSEALYKNLGFSFRLPHDYEIIYMDSTRNILQLGVARPHRNIIVYWQEGGFNKVIDENYALRIKHWLMQNLMEKIYIEKSYARYRSVDWGGVIVHNIRGLWAHPTKLMGGPFSLFYFYDGVTDRTYYIDCMLFAPGQSKAVYLRQMEIVASTFYTKK